MKYIDEYRDGALARGLAAAIARAVRPDRGYALMEFCGGHTHAIARYGIEDLLPPEIRLIHGPGCPVCVLPIGRLAIAHQLARLPQVILCSYADLLRVPGEGGVSLLTLRADGADVRMIYAASDALRLAIANPDREVVFFAIGFETTTPPTALVLQQAKALGLKNFSVVCNHVLTPAAIAAIVAHPDRAQVQLDGFVGPAHVSTVIGSRPYEYFAETYRKPVVIAGFEPLDVLQAILMLVQQIEAGRHVVENEFRRAVTPDGNRKAQAIMADCFERRASFEWRGLGAIPDSALAIRDRYAAWDAERRFAVATTPIADNKACECGAILRGVKKPVDCRLFGTVCTPENPIGSCMVSAEGACAAQWSYGRFRATAAETVSA